MAKQERRAVSIWINGKEVENSLAGIQKAMQGVNRDLKKAAIGSEEYEKAVADWKKLNGVLDDHRTRLRGIAGGHNLLKAGLQNMAGIAAGAFAVDALIGYGKHLFNTAVKMEALGKKAATVFGETLPQVTVEAKKNAAAMGLTTAQYIAAAAAAQDLLVPMGFQRQEAAGISSQLTNLSGALSEWTGGQKTAEEVSATLTKALLGERDELKSLGIAISEEDVKTRLAAEGHAKLTGQALQQAKAMATLNLILEKSVDAQNAYATNSDSMIRRQAELSAKVSEITEKLAVIFLPVLERIAGFLAAAADGVLYLADAFGGADVQAKKASAAFDEQGAKVRSLEGDILPLLARYDELKGKTNLTKAEQAELKTIIEKVSGAIPTAIQGFDDYGRALGLNTEAAREFIKVEKARLLFVNDEAISTNEKAVSEMEKRADILRYQLESSTKTATAMSKTGFGFVSETQKLTGEEIAARQADLGKLMTGIEGAKAEVARLKGDALDIPTPTATPTGGGNSGGGGSTPAEREKKAKEQAKKLEGIELDLQKRLQSLIESEQLLAIHDEEARAIAAIEQRFAKELEAAKTGEFANQTEVKKLVVQIEAQKEAEIARTRADFQAKKLEKDKEFFEKQAADRKAEAVKEQEEYLDGQNWLAEREKERLAAQDEIEKFQAVTEDQKRQLELDALQTQFDLMLLLADDYGIKATDLAAAHKAKEAEINAKYDKEIADKAAEAHKKRLEAWSSTFSSFGDLAQATFDLLGEEGAKSAGFQKAITLFQIAMDTASAISSLMAMSEANPANAVTFGVAGIGQYVAGIARIVANVAKAKKLLSSPVPQKMLGGYHDVTGQTDGKTYRAAGITPPSTGLLPGIGPVVFPSAAGGPVLANERGREYFVASDDLRKPAIAGLVSQIHRITKGGSATVPQFADGGAMPAGAIGPSGGSSFDAAVLADMVAVNRQLLQVLQKGILATIDDPTLIAIDRRKAKINAASGGFYS